MTDDQINDLRRRIDNGEAVSNEELMAGLAAIRQARVNAPASTKKTAAVSVGKIDLAGAIAKLKGPQQNPS